MCRVCCITSRQNSSQDVKKLWRTHISKREKLTQFVLMLDRRRGRWAVNKTTLGQRLVISQENTNVD